MAIPISSNDSRQVVHTLVPVTCDSNDCLKTGSSVALARVWDHL